MSRFVRPDTTVLHISEGDTLTVKRRLTAGEQREHYARMYRPGEDGRLHINPLQTGISLVLAYLVDWSLTDDTGSKVEIRDLPKVELEAVLNSLDQPSFTEIKNAIETHERVQDEAREEEKKRRAGSSGDGTISPSPSAPAGELIGSVN